MKVARLWMFVTRSCERDHTFVLVRINVSSRTFSMMDNCGNATCVQESVIICLLLRFLLYIPFFHFTLHRWKEIRHLYETKIREKYKKWYSNHPLLYCKKLKFHLCFELWRTNKTCTFHTHPLTNTQKVVKLRFIVFSTFFHKITENQSN